MDENEQGKEVYARYGLAMLWAQNLERVIGSAMLVFGLLPNVKRTTKSRDEREQLFDAFWDRQLRKTLGGLVTAIRSVTELPDDLAAALDECNRKRIWLAHHFFPEQAAEFQTERGRTHMIRELRQARDLFKSTFETFERTVQPAWDKLGITEERLQEFSASYIRQLRGHSGQKT